MHGGDLMLVNQISQVRNILQLLAPRNNKRGPIGQRAKELTDAHIEGG